MSLLNTTQSTSVTNMFYWHAPLLPFLSLFLLGDDLIMPFARFHLENGGIDKISFNHMEHFALTFCIFLNSQIFPYQIQDSFNFLPCLLMELGYIEYPGTCTFLHVKYH